MVHILISKMVQLSLRDYEEDYHSVHCQGYVERELNSELSVPKICADTDDNSPIKLYKERALTYFDGLCCYRIFSISSQFDLKYALTSLANFPPFTSNLFTFDHSSY